MEGWKLPLIWSEWKPDFGSCLLIRDKRHLKWIWLLLCTSKDFGPEFNILNSEETAYWRTKDSAFFFRVCKPGVLHGYQQNSVRGKCCSSEWKKVSCTYIISTNCHSTHCPRATLTSIFYCQYFSYVSKKVRNYNWSTRDVNRPALLSF